MTTIEMGADNEASAIEIRSLIQVLLTLPQDAYIVAETILIADCNINIVGWINCKDETFVEIVPK